MKLPNFAYHLARAEGRAVRAAYVAALGAIGSRLATIKSDVGFAVCSYSGEAMLPEQVASIRSFLRFAGRPRRFVVFSDGTHSKRSIELLRRIDRCVEVRDVPRIDDAIGSSRAYLETHATGRQLALMMSLPLEMPTLYVDSDVLFFPAAKNIETLLSATASAPASYLPDCQLEADERLFRAAEERTNPVNTGMIYFRQKLDWSIALRRFGELDGEPRFHTNQTLTHLVMHANGAAPLDRKMFVLQLDDQFTYRDAYAASTIAARHYVNPVRHKFWTALRR